jgi:drug/metabolite transporter (DMT)-like permease
MFIPATLVASLGSVGVVTTSVIASFTLGERLNFVGKMASLLAILGNLVVIVHSPKVGVKQYYIL